MKKFILFLLAIFFRTQPREFFANVGHGFIHVSNGV